MKRAQHLQAGLKGEEKVAINLRLFMYNKIATHTITYLPSFREGILIQISSTPLITSS